MMKIEKSRIEEYLKKIRESRNYNQIVNCVAFINFDEEIEFYTEHESSSVGNVALYSGEFLGLTYLTDLRYEDLFTLSEAVEIAYRHINNMFNEYEATNANVNIF